MFIPVCLVWDAELGPNFTVFYMGLCRRLVSRSHSILWISFLKIMPAITGRKSLSFEIQFSWRACDLSEQSSVFCHIASGWLGNLFKPHRPSCKMIFIYENVFKIKGALKKDKYYTVSWSHICRPIMVSFPSVCVANPHLNPLWPSDDIWRHRFWSA